MCMCSWKLHAVLISHSTRNVPFNLRHFSAIEISAHESPSGIQTSPDGTAVCIRLSNVKSISICYYEFKISLKFRNKKNQIRQQSLFAPIPGPRRALSQKVIINMAVANKSSLLEEMNCTAAAN